MKINFLLPHYGYRPTGGFKVVYIYANEFAKKGIEVNLIYPASCKKGMRVIPGWVRTYLGRKRKSDWFIFEKEVNRIYVSALLEKNIPDADFTIATAYETSLFLKNYSTTKGKKIYFIQDLEIWAGKQEKILASWKFDMCKIVISQHLMNIGETAGIQNLHYLPNAIDRKKYYIIRDIESRKNCIAMMYSKAERKGSSYGIEAIGRIKAQKPDIEAVLFGKYPRPTDLPIWIEYYENPEQEFLVKEIYNRAKVFICSSIYEGWGLPAMEAMACGAAVVTTDCGGVRDFAIQDVTAKICKVRNAGDIEQAVLEILEDDIMLNNLVNNAQQELLKFDWGKNSESFLDIIQRG